MTAAPVSEGAYPVGGGKVVLPVDVGVLHRNDRFPHLYWQNFLSVDPAPALTAEQLIAEADQLFADLPIRHVLVADAKAAERLRLGFLESGYKEAVLVTMVSQRPADREPPGADLVELGAAELAPTVEAYVRGGSRDEDARRELCRLKDDLGRDGVGFLAARVDGEVAGWCELRRHGSGGRWRTWWCWSHSAREGWLGPWSAGGRAPKERRMRPHIRRRGRPRHGEGSLQTPRLRRRPAHVELLVPRPWVNVQPGQRSGPQPPGSSSCD